MGRYGYGSGAFAVRAKAKKKRRTSVVSDRVYVNYEKYNNFQKLLEKRKSSRDSSRSAPGVVQEESDAPDKDTLIPGQIPATGQEQEAAESKSLIVPTEAIVPGPSWWPGPPLQQGGVVRPPSPLASNGTVSNGVSEAPGPFSGFTEGPWLEIQAKLMPEAEKALKYGQRLFLDQELPNGKNAWGKHGAGKLKAAENQKRRVNKNKVQDDDVVPYNHDEDEDDEEEFTDDSYEESESDYDNDSDSEDDEPIADSGADASLEKNPDGHYRQTGVVNIVLYVGFGLVTLGLIITFVGIGEHGFKSPELQLIGPSLIGCGILFCLLRLFFCSVPTCCSMCGGKKQLDEKALLSPSRETLADDSTEDQNIPRPLAPEEEKEPEENEQNPASKSAQTIRSTIPNYIEDEGDDDHSLGLHVEYIDEASKQSTGGSRPASSQSKISLASKASKLPDIHSNASRSNSELVLNPATLQSAGD